MRKVLLISPSIWSTYSESKVKVAVPNEPSLTIATLAAPLIEANFAVDVLDLSISKNPWSDIMEKLEDFSPTHVAITFRTPSFNEVVHIAEKIKEFDKNISIIGGGPHVSACPDDTLAKSMIDIAIIGEGDYALRDTVSGNDMNAIGGVYSRRGSKILSSSMNKEYIKDLDSLPFPYWGIFDIKKYKMPKLLSKKNPVGSMETSRGCVFRCCYCNKNIFGRTFRSKSAKRVVDEMEYMLNIGFREIHIQDDGFSTDITRAKDICNEILKRKLRFPWNPINGIRVDRFDKELAEKMYMAGCYSVSFGVESGDQEVINKINKGIKLEDVKKSVSIAKKAGLETIAFFMLGLPGETEESMRKTIEFAKEVDPDIAKVTINTPLPGTPLYMEWKNRGYIKTDDWSKYNFHNPEDVYVHPNLDWDTIHRYYDMFYREFYFRPKFIFRRIKNGILNGTLLNDIYPFLKTKW